MQTVLKSSLRPACVLLLAFTVLCGAAYPALVTVTAKLLFPAKAEGSLVMRDGKAVGSALLGQPFSSPKYFWGRPSATTPPQGGLQSGGSNLGPLNPGLSKAARERAEALARAHPGVKTFPVELLTASASGLDPHISLSAARMQVPRVARARGMKEAALHGLLEQHTEGDTLRLVEEPYVNVLLLNLALDAAP